jgi:hypothetical protein
MIRIGDIITYRPGFGSQAPKQAVIRGMEVTKRQREKYGEQVSQVSEELVWKNRVCFDFEDGHWCYSEQVDLVALNHQSVTLRQILNWLQGMSDEQLDATVVEHDGVFTLVGDLKKTPTTKS